MATPSLKAIGMRETARNATICDAVYVELYDVTVVVVVLRLGSPYGEERRFLLGMDERARIVRERGT